MASFLDLFGVTDTDGVNASRYQINFATGGLRDLMSVDTQIFGMIAKGLYLVFQWMAILANALLGLVFSSDGWLSKLGEVYQKVFGPLYAVFPPWAIAALGIAVVAFSSVSSNIGSKGYGESMAKRMAGALGMTVLVILLAYNPFAMLARLFEIVNGFSGALAAAVSGGDRDELLTVGQPMVDATLRSPTIALNYGRDFSEKCQGLWSEAMRKGTALSVDSGCFTRGDDAGGPGQIATAAGLLLLAVPMLYFCVIATWKYVEHLTMAAVFLLGTGWAAAVGVFQRRGFDTLSKFFARSGAHLVIAVIVSMLTVALPAAFSGLGMALFGALGDAETRVFGQILGLGVGFAVSAWAIRRVTATHGLLLTALQADTKTNLEILMGSNTKDTLSFKNTRHWANPNAAKGPGGPGGPRPGGNLGKVLAADPTAATRGGQRKAAGVGAGDPGDSPASAPAADPVAQLAASAAPLGPDPSTAAGTPTLLFHIAPRRTVTPPSGAAVAAGAVAAAAAVSPPRTVPALAAPVTPALTVTPPATGIGRPATVLTPTLNPLGTTPSVEAAGTPAGRGLLADGASLADSSAETGTGDLTPVPGNVFADPALNAAAKGVGAVFVAGPAPLPRRVINWSRQFMPRRPVEAPTDGIPEIEYAPALVPATAGTADPGGDFGDKSLRDRIRVGAATVARRLGRVSESAPAPAAAAAGLQAGENVHPQSFLAAQSDALETSQLKADLEEAQNLCGAMGVDMRVDFDPSDNRLSLNLSSDPEERVRPSDEVGFGEPV